MDRQTLERRQVWIYLASILGGLAVGGAWPGLAKPFEVLLWPVLAALLFVTFLQVPLLHVRDAFRDRRFVSAVLVGNFLVLPVLAWLLAACLPGEPDLRLGVLLVLLVPCTDWFLPFNQLGGGDAARAVALTPVNLLLQLFLLPGYLWLMAGTEFVAVFSPATAWPAGLVVFAPLAAAALAERWIESRGAAPGLRERSGWWTVPLLAVVVFLIAGAQVVAVRDSLFLLPAVVPLFIAFLLAAAWLARVMARFYRLPVDQGRTLAFSFGTRNSFVVLPLALALPPGWEAVAVVVVLQSLVELFGMAVFVRWVPERLFPEGAR
ncbi:MAG: hypothetical protein KF884_05250 [Fimbriimonadaceae bacterium]|nr:hypothetical protein [Fimbriimonadaceae bacterium]QYK59491.1 MAG: hypothetical protein KF884_05250 [Fimbriimonadaceae bacterium]